MASESLRNWLKKEEENNTPPGKKISAEITTSYDRISIHNTGQKSWVNVNVYINGMPGFGYKATIKYLEAGDSGSVMLRNFTKSSGARFNPDAYAVKELWIGGGEYDYSKFGF